MSIHKSHLRWGIWAVAINSLLSVVIGIMLWNLRDVSNSDFFAVLFPNVLLGLPVILAMTVIPFLTRILPDDHTLGTAVILFVYLNIYWFFAGVLLGKIYSKLRVRSEATGKNYILRVAIASATILAGSVLIFAYAQYY